MPVPLSTDERRALAIIAALLILAGGARWIERPRPVLAGGADVDLAALEQASRDAKPVARTRAQAPGTGGSPARIAAAPGGTATGPGTASSPTGTPNSGAGRLDPNTATVQELATLPGVGPALAARIVEQRERTPFRSTADLTRVQGIGPALAARLAPAVSLPAGTAQQVDGAGSGVTAAPLGLTDAERRSAEADQQAAREAAQRNSPRPPAVSQPAAGSAAPTGRHPAATGPVAAPASAVPLDLNRATVAELQQLSGVGPVLAAKIVARRDSIGGFRTWEDVDAVSGIGPALLARIRQFAVLERIP